MVSLDRNPTPADYVQADRVVTLGIGDREGCDRPYKLVTVPRRQSVEHRIRFDLHTFKQMPSVALETFNPLVGDSLDHIGEVNVRFGRVEVYELPQPADRVLHMGAKLKGVGHGWIPKGAPKR